MSDERGRFAFFGLGTGEYALSVRHLGIQSAGFPVRAIADAVTVLSLEVPVEVLPLEELEVEVTTRRTSGTMADFYRPMAEGG